MPGKVVSLRLDAELLKRVDARAKELGKDRTAFLTWAMENALDDAQRGVPDVPKPAPAKQPVKPQPNAPVEDWHTWAMQRQQKLNEAKGRRG